MLDSSSLIVGLEIGTSKVNAMVGEVSPAGEVSVIGVGQSKSRGVRKGEIVDPIAAKEDVRNAIIDAEQMADVEIRSVYLGVTGGHTSGFNNRACHPIFSADHEITRADMDDVLKISKAITLPVGNVVVHTIRQHFLVDGQGGIANPVGLFGQRLEVDMHVIHGNHNRLQSAIGLVDGLNLEVEAIAFNGLASAMALLSNEQKELGTLVIDMGAGTTEYVVYANGIIRHSGVIAVGGDHVTNDLAIGLKLPIARAEQLKLEHGASLMDPSLKGRTITQTSDVGLHERTINLEHLRRIMSMRLEEVFQLIEQDLDKTGLLDYLRAGVVICGGCAHIPDIGRLAERVFHMPATAAQPCAVSGLATALNQPEFVTAIGLVKFGAFQQQRISTRPTLVGGIKSTITSFFRRG